MTTKLFHTLQLRPNFSEELEHWWQAGGLAVCGTDSRRVTREGYPPTRNYPPRPTKLLWQRGKLFAGGRVLSFSRGEHTSNRRHLPKPNGFTFFQPLRSLLSSPPTLRLNGRSLLSSLSLSLSLSACLPAKLPPPPPRRGRR